MRVAFLDMSVAVNSTADFAERGTGGRYGSLHQVSNELASRGHDVWVVARIQNPGESWKGVRWICAEPPPVDVLVLNRGIGSGFPELKARHRVLWTHDLPHNGFIPDPKTAAALSMTVFMSRYGEGVWRHFFRDIGKGCIIPNGYDPELFYPPKYRVDRCAWRMIYASAPNRGLDKLPLIFQAIKNRSAMPVKMTAFSNMAKLHPGEGEDTWEAAYGACREAGIDLRDPVPQSELADWLRSSGMMILPTSYPEICSNIVIQALACGCPVVTTGGLGATPEWVRDGWNGKLTRYRSEDYMIHDLEIVRAALGLLDNPRKHERICENAPKTKGLYTWAEIGRQWDRMLRRLS